jgi:hypothetical protein
VKTNPNIRFFCKHGAMLYIITQKKADSVTSAASFQEVIISNHGDIFNSSLSYFVILSKFWVVILK